MNKYYESNDRFNSNKRIFDAYYEETESRANSVQKVLDGILYLLSAILSALLSVRARRLTKAFALCVCFVGFIGVVGAIDHGTLSLGTGLLIALGLLAIELLCLRGSAKH